MFEDINVSAKSFDGVKADANFKDTFGVIDGIASIVQGWLDPQVSPEVREKYYRDYLISKDRFSKLSKAPVKFYQIELPTEEVRIVPGIFDGYHVLFIDGDYYIPVEYSWTLYSNPMNFRTESLPRYKLKQWFVLGR